MIVKKIVVGPLESNCFIIADEESKRAMVIDPGDEPDRIMGAIRKQGLIVDYVVCTHAHFDHLGALVEIAEATGGKIVIHKDELMNYRSARELASSWGYELGPLPEPDIFVEEGSEIKLGNLTFNVFHTPGHSPGGICLYGESVVVTGDTLFEGSVGRTDLLGGDIDGLKRSFRRLMSLPPETKVLTGHGADSTIGRERSQNFFHAYLT
jgi:hydroxyacylglutathione hydrolase